MPIAEITIGSLGELISATKDVCAIHPHNLMWFRGQGSNSEFRLRPKVRRHHSYEQEHSFAAMFIQQAPIRYPNAPSPYDYPRWLTLMQHYGLPTRLLDWTQSPLVAAYFALNNETNGGVIWGLYPMRLNQLEARVDRVQLIRSHDVAQFVKEAFDFHESEGGAEGTRAIYGETIDVRMLVQQSAFTIHADDQCLEDHPHADDVLVKFVLDPKKHLEMGIELHHCGVYQSHLFPDLENLAEAISGHPKYLVRPIEFDDNE